MEVPDPHLAAQAAAGNDAGVGGMELDAPGGAGVALQGLQAAPGLHLRDVDVVVAVRGGHHRPVRGEHHQKGGSDETERGYTIKLAYFLPAVEIWSGALPKISICEARKEY